MTRPLPKSLQDNPQLGAWFRIETPGRLTLLSGKVELGQGIRTALLQIAAEELELDPAQLVIAPLNTAQGPNEWLTASSQSIESGGMALRLAAATLRAVALETAARISNQPLDGLSWQAGSILHDAALTGHDLWNLVPHIDWAQPVRADVALKPRATHRLVGQAMPRQDLPQILAGGGFLHDMSWPGMLHGRVLHPPVWRAKLSDVPVAEFQRRFGDDCRLLRRGDFLALVAASESCVRQAAEYLAPRLLWSAPELFIPEDIAPWLAAAPARLLRDDAAPPAAAKPQRASYSRGFLLHGAIGPSCAVALWRDSQLKIWSHSQGVFILRAQIARVLNLAAEAVEIEHRPGAGCYGHNGADDVALEAALLAQAFPGRHVRVLWSRAAEMSATCGSAMRIDLAASLDDAGQIAAWQATIASGSHTSRPGAAGEVNLLAAAACDPAFMPQQIADVPDAVGSGALRNAVPLYDLPAPALRHRLLTELPLRTSSLRGLGAHANVFAIEGFMDELAETAGCDALEFRRRHLNDPRALAVLNQAAAMAGWQPHAETGSGSAMGIGLARYKNKSGYCAIVAEVEVAEAVRVTRIWCAVDGGEIINPDGACNQIEGGILQSLSWSLLEAVRSENGQSASLDWQGYPILRFTDVPEITTHLFSRPDAPPLGLGEVSQGPMAAALGNAASRALGLRLRDLPLSRERLMAAMLRDA